MEQLGREPVPIGDAYLTVGGFTHYATKLVPGKIFLIRNPKISLSLTSCHMPSSCSEVTQTKSKVLLKFDNLQILEEHLVHSLSSSLLWLEDPKALSHLKTYFVDIFSQSDSSRSIPISWHLSWNMASRTKHHQTKHKLQIWSNLSLYSRFTLNFCINMP